MNWWIFGDGTDDSDGCNGHHFENYELQDKLRVKKKNVEVPRDDKDMAQPINGKANISSRRAYDCRDLVFRGSCFRVEQKERATCEHEGCHATDGHWKRLGYIPNINSIEAYDRNEIVEVLRDDV
jgi:hypothetical protein